MTNKKTLLVLSQVYLPDPASVGQHMADLAEKMTQNNWQVIVITSNRGYDNHEEKYKNVENIRGVQVYRLSFTSFGKGSIFKRVAGQVSLLVQTVFKCLSITRPDAILVSTNLVFIIAPFLRIVKNIPYIYWVMDLNPDQAIAAGILKADSLSAKFYNWLQYLVLDKANTVVSLDQFMYRRVNRKKQNILNHIVLPPWPHDNHLVNFSERSDRFREKNNWNNKRVLMYSGNHSLVHPLDTFLSATKEFENEKRFLMAFVGGGLGKGLVEKWIINNPRTPVVAMPYQPLDNLYQSLSAADIHLVSMGDNMIGCVHPCKIYSAMAVGKPVLLLGNLDNHITEILEEYDIGWSVKHGDVESMINILMYLRDVDEGILIKKGQNGKEVIEKKFSQKILLDKFCHFVEETQLDN